MIFRTSDYCGMGCTSSDGHANVQSGNCAISSAMPLDPRPEDPYLSKHDREQKVLLIFWREVYKPQFI